MSSTSSSGVANTPRHARSRTQSFSSDRPSTIGTHGLMTPPLTVTPEAAFIAASAASQIVTTDHDNYSESWYDEAGIEPSGETALVSPGALQLANNFVDQLLFNIIAVSKSTTLSALRPAVSEVLKPKLAKDAINQAEEELREYLGGGEVADLAQSSQESSTELPKDWDLELVWKRTRLRCMVYSSLGDMEEEDEDLYMEQEHLRGESEDFSSETVPPAVAIFLTSILEFMGEHVLVVAGQAAFNRLRAKYEKDLKDGILPPRGLADRIVVEELDMERVALDRTLGRLWRAWKKRIRSPLEPNFSRSFSRSSASQIRRASSVTDLSSSLRAHRDAIIHDEGEVEVGSAEKGTAKANTSDLDPASLPLPDSDIEVTYSDEEEDQDGESLPPRPRSWIAPRPSAAGLILSHVSIRRARSLPSRKRPWYISANVSDDDVAPKDTKGKSEQLNSRNIADISAPDGDRDFMSAVSRHKKSTNGVENTTTGRGSYGLKGQAEAGSEAKSSSGLVEKMVTGATAVGRTAAAGLAVVTTGNASQPEIEEDEIEEFTEEPEIMTSSRVSIGGANSPAISESGRPPSLIQARSNSVRSLRLIDVQGPRSPSIRSQAGSVDAHDPLLSPVARSASTAREAGNSTPPIVEENDADLPSVTIYNRNTIVIPSTNDGQHVNTVVSPRLRNRSPPKSIPSPTLSTPTAPSQVTIFTSHTGITLEEAPDFSHTPVTTMRSSPLPILPERSVSRPNYRNEQPSLAQRVPPESPKLPRPVQTESPSPSTSAKFKPMRSSEDSSNSIRPVDVARNFEELIQSNETLQYTLTPENMRDTNSPIIQQNNSPKAPSPRSRKSEDTKRSRSSSLKRSISITKATGLSSHPPTAFPINGRYGGTVPRAPSTSSRVRTGTVPQARDARVPRESMNDFAEFIRSTGPPGDTGAAYPTRATLGNSTVVRNITGPTHSKGNASIDSRRTDYSARIRLQARDPTVNQSSESSELIDFIRRGPPNANSNNPRIPRTVAPFRTTMDSDQLQMTGAVGGKAVDATVPNVRESRTSTNVTESSAPSSLNSQSALLNKTNKSQFYSADNFDDDDMMPKRTRRRVRDPYAIDFSDEEDELELGMTPKPMPKQKQKQEESLIDFLNNYPPPPPEPTPQPVVIPKKKASAPNLIARLRSAGSSNGGSGSSLSRKLSNAGERSMSRSLSSRAGNNKSHTPIVIPPGAEKFGNNFASTIRPQTESSGRVPMRKFEPREAVSNSATSDLANFLRDSEPPPSTLASLPSPTEDKGSHGFSRLFERRKKSTVY
ncbi:hypothetical protein F5X99DRAFT_147636 [Biscogniauxia marginata]|nr:hypothetical protein F5X99DRAFT_147636 [Biscogniauxia marginata]